jgi:hypothetical protein
MTRAGFEPAISATKRPQTYALHRAVTEIGLFLYSLTLNCIEDQGKKTLFDVDAVMKCP